MQYTANRGVTGHQLPQRYTIDKGARMAYSPKVLAETINLPDIDWEVAGRYMAVPLVSVIMLATFWQGIHETSPVKHPTPVPTKPTSGNVLHVANASTVQSAPAQGTTVQSTNSASAMQSAPSNLISDVVAPVSSTPSTPAATTPTDPTTINGTTPTDPGTTTDPTGGLGGGDTGGTTTPPTGTDPSTGTDPTSGGGLTVTTPVAQVGVDVFPPSASVSL